MVDSVNLGNVANNVQFRAKTSKVVNPQIDTDEKVQINGVYVDKKNAMAVIKNITHPVNMTKPVALDDYKKMLADAGLVEGKDFEVKKFDKAGHAIMLIRSKDEPDKIIKRVYWRGGEGIENYDGCTETMYPNNPEIVSINLQRNPQGRVTEQTTTYANPDKHKELFPKNIDMSTTAKDYKKILDEQKVKYVVFEDKEVPNLVVFLEFGSDGKTVVKETNFYDAPDCKDIDQYVKNDKGEFVRATHLVKMPEEGIYNLSVTLSMDEIIRMLQTQKK